MPTAEFIASAVLPLLVALFNLLAAGYAIGAAGGQRSRMVFAAGPAGVGLWAVAWFVSVFNPAVIESMRTLGAAGGLLAISGFAVDALVLLKRRTAALSLVGAVAIGVGLYQVLAPVYEIEFATFFPRLLAVALIGVTVTARWLARKRVDAATARLGRHVIAASLACSAAYAVFAGYALVAGRAGVDPLLMVILVSETLALVYIGNGRIALRIILSRAVTYAILSMAVAVVAAFTFHALGYPIDVAQISVTVAIALFAAILFMGLGELMTTGVERLLFPERARLTRALGASRGEVAALKRRLEQAERLAIVGELAASVAHEIKNPLAPIRGYAQLLGGKLDSVPDDQRELFARGLGIIQSESDRIDGRVQELLGLARGEKTTASSDQTLPLNQVVMEAVAVAEGDAAGAAIEQSLDSSIDHVRGSADEIRGALLNLLKNASESMQGVGGQIDVRTSVENGHAIVEVLDEGAGLTAEQAERVFEAFYTTKDGGTGLGMAITRSAVEAAGGTIRISPRTDRTGAHVRVELEMTAPRPVEPAP